jgi:ATP-dependent DNA helicase RecQ
MPEKNCGACDNCLSPRDTFDGTLLAQKFLSCVYRVREKSGFAVGLNHVIEVLTGADTEKVRRWNHHQISTYGIGQEKSRPEWQAIGRELIRLGYLEQSADKFTTLELTPEGRAALKQRKGVTLTKPKAAPPLKLPRAGEVACDEVLFERLRQLRKRLADERGLPPYIIFSDVSLRQMAREYPTNDREFARISGVGERKRQEFGAVFLAEIAEHLRTNPRQIFADDSFVPPSSPQKRSVGDSVRETLRRFRAGLSIEQIARDRNVVVNTIYTHLAEAVECGEELDLNRLVTGEERREIEHAAAIVGWVPLSDLFKKLGEKYSYGQLRVIRAAHQGSGFRLEERRFGS